MRARVYVCMGVGGGTSALHSGGLPGKDPLVLAPGARKAPPCTLRILALPVQLPPFKNVEAEALRGDGASPRSLSGERTRTSAPVLGLGAALCSLLGGRGQGRGKLESASRDTRLSCSLTLFLSFLN